MAFGSRKDRLANHAEAVILNMVEAIIFHKCDGMRELSSGIIIFRRSDGERLYLLLHYQFKGDYWDFPRGNLRKDETPKQAAIREAAEETSLSEDDLMFFKGFEEGASWFYKLGKKPVEKRVTYFLAETRREEVRISEEHVGFKWLNFKNALRLLKYKNSKKLLLRAEDFLQELNERASKKE